MSSAESTLPVTGLRSPWPDVSIPALSLSEFVLGRRHELGDRADRPALIDAVTGHRVTYDEVVDLADRTAAALQDRGIGRGDVVAIFSQNNWQYAVALHGVLRTGATVTTVSPLYTPDELNQQLRHAKARLVFVSTAMLASADGALAADGWRDEDVVVMDGDRDPRHPHLDDFVARPRVPRPVAIDPADDVALLPYSSGTSGRSKGVLLTHRNLVANMLQTQAFMTRLGPESRTLAVMPFFHIYGVQIVLNQSLLAGACVVTIPRFELPVFLKAVQDHRIDRLPVAPPVLVLLAKDPSVDDYDLSSVKYLSSGAAPLNDEVVNLVRQRLGCHVRQGYGMTELSPATHAVPDHRTDIPAGAVGLTVPNLECRVVDPDTGVDTGPGDPGELWVRGPNVMKGYLDDDKATSDTIDSDGFLHTGDVVVYDENGVMTVVDRVKELIKYKGHQVPPAELEAVLLGHDQIADAAVTGVPDPEAGELPKAFVVLSQGAELSEQDVVDFVAARVAPYKKVRVVSFVGAIPKSPSGKILRRKLAAL